jgi:hypothetical protein
MYELYSERTIKCYLVVVATVVVVVVVDSLEVGEGEGEGDGDGLGNRTFNPTLVLVSSSAVSSWRYQELVTGHESVTSEMLYDAANV